MLSVNQLYLKIDLALRTITLRSVLVEVTGLGLGKACFVVQCVGWILIRLLR